jgi:hypothetical protein
MFQTRNYTIAPKSSIENGQELCQSLAPVADPDKLPYTIQAGTDELGTNMANVPLLLALLNLRKGKV